MKKEESKKEANLVCEPGIGFSQRDKNIKIQEEKGLFDFLVIRNTGENNKENLDNMKLLTDLKNIIAKQLPKMPKEYIVRLVFDKHHESMIIIKSKIYYINIYLLQDQAIKFWAVYAIGPTRRSNLQKLHFQQYLLWNRSKGSEHD